MPDITTLSTEDLCHLVKEEDWSDFTPVEVGGELLERLIPANDTAISLTEYRGGIRPLHAPSH